MSFEINACFLEYTVVPAMLEAGMTLRTNFRLDTNRTEVRVTHKDGRRWTLYPESHEELVTKLQDIRSGRVPAEEVNP